MGTAYGFVTTTPDTRWGDTEGSLNADSALAAKYTAGGTGTIEVSEVGLYLAGSGSYIVVGIFEHDAVNNCPGTLVTNAQTDALGPMEGTVGKWSHTYGTKPRLTGGNTYWIALIGTGASGYQISRFADGLGTGIFITTGLTYPTFPTDTQWETHTDVTHRYAFYAVYSEVATSQAVRPGADRTGSTFQAIQVHTPGPGRHRILC